MDPELPLPIAVLDSICLLITVVVVVAVRTEWLSGCVTR